MAAVSTEVGSPRRRLWLHGGRRLHGVLLGAAGLLLVLVLWDLAVRIFDLSVLVLPAPSEVLEALWRMLSTSPSSPTSLYYQAVPTLEATLIGFAGACLLGFVLGFLLFEWKAIGQFLWPLVIAFQALPKVAIAPVLVIWLGPTIESKIVLVVIVAFFPVFINTMVGLESLEEDVEEMLRSFGAKRRHMLRLGRFPAALPVLFAGIESALLLSLVAIVVAEFVAGQRGLGFLVTQAQYNLDMPAVFAVLIVFSVLGVIFLEVITWLERKVVFWKTTRRGVLAYVEGDGVANRD